MAANALDKKNPTEWRYERVLSGADTQTKKGVLTTWERNGESYISLKQFCYAFGCRLLNQWGKFRAVVENTTEKQSALISHFSRYGVFDGKVHEFKHPVLLEDKEGFLIPLSSAVILSNSLRLGNITELPKTDKKETASSAAVLTSNLKREFKKIVIDPGHGGADMGTKSGSLFEKDLALLYAFKLREELYRQMPTVEVVLTREKDEFISLPDRAIRANDGGAQLFISLHLNHAVNPSVEGSETYILSTEATDNDAKKLALSENESWMKSTKVDGKIDNPIVKNILVDVEQTKYIQDSALYGSFIQQELKDLEKTTGLKVRGVKQAMFYVLSQVSMPSVLVEMAFLSHSGDRSRLMDLKFRDRFCASIAVATKRYRDKILNTTKNKE